LLGAVLSGVVGSLDFFTLATLVMSGSLAIFFKKKIARLESIATDEINGGITDSVNKKRVKKHDVMKDIISILLIIAAVIFTVGVFSEDSSTGGAIVLILIPVLLLTGILGIARLISNSIKKLKNKNRQ